MAWCLIKHKGNFFLLLLRMFSISRLKIVSGEGVVLWTGIYCWDRWSIHMLVTLCERQRLWLVSLGSLLSVWSTNIDTFLTVIPVCKQFCDRLYYTEWVLKFEHEFSPCILMSHVRSLQTNISACPVHDTALRICSAVRFSMLWLSIICAL